MKVTISRYNIFIFILVLSCNSSLLANTNWNLDTKNGKVEFEAVGNPSMLKIHGEGSAPSGKLEFDDKKIIGEILFDLKTLDTKMDTRNEHMKNKYLEVDKFPQATLKITKIDLPPEFKNEKFSGKSLIFEGLLKLHGVEKSISGKTDIEKTLQQIAVNANFSIKVSDFAIAIPEFAGITMTENVDLKVSTLAYLNK